MFKQLLVFSVAISAFNPITSLDFKITPRDLIIGISALGAGAIASGMGAYYYHPASLEKQKRAVEYEEKKKKEEALAQEKEHVRIAELQKLQAQNVMLTIQHIHKDEIEKVRKEKLHERDALLTIIKENCGMKDMPLNTYYQQLLAHIESLKSLETMLPQEKDHERMLLIEQLERVVKLYNMYISEKARQEKDENETRRKKEELEQRKIEKEQLEVKKLRLEVENIKESRQDLYHIRTGLDALTQGFTHLQTKETERTTEIMNALYTIRAKQVQDAEEIKNNFSKTHEKIDLKFTILFRLFDQARQYVNQLVGQPPALPQPPASFTPHASPQMPAPSAPPL